MTALPRPDGTATRAELAELTGLSIVTLERLWRARETNGHPAPVVTVRPMRWDWQAWQQWHATQPTPAPARRAGRPNAPRYLYDGDPRLDLARRVLAEHPDARTGALVRLLDARSDRPTSPSSWRKILLTAREHPEP